MSLPEIRRQRAIDAQVIKFERDHAAMIPEILLRVSRTCVEARARMPFYGRSYKHLLLN
jgi:hypothetical protein